MILQQEGRQGVIGQRGRGHRLREGVLSRRHRQIGELGTGIGVPDVGGDGLTPVAGVAGDPGIGDMGLPGRVGLQGHLEHVPGHELLVLVIQGAILGGMAVVAALRLRPVRGDPFGDGQHQAVELRDAQITQDLDVLVHILGLGGDVRGRGLWCRGNIRGDLGGVDTGVDHRLHADAPVAQLHHVLRGALAAGEADQGGGTGHGQGQGLASEHGALHCAPPGSKDGSGRVFSGRG